MTAISFKLCLETKKLFLLEIKYVESTQTMTLRHIKQAIKLSFI